MRRTTIVDLGCVLICLLAASPAFAQADAEYAKAAQEYAAGDFKRAIEDYESIVRSSKPSANLFYDLGNAYFRVADFGRAILNYERALALERNHPEARANLQIARDQARALELTPAPAERALRFATTNQFTTAAAVAFWLGAFVLARSLFARRSGAATGLSILSLLVFGGAAFAAYQRENGSNGKDLAIIIGSEVEARLATADNAHTVLTLPPGSEIKIHSMRGDWIYAALPNNLRGWLPAKSAERVRP